MSNGHPLRVVRDPAPALPRRAAADLRFIRETMERAGPFTAVPGKGGIAMGAVGCAAAAVASAQTSAVAWLAAWLVAAGVAVVVGVVALAMKSRADAADGPRVVGARFARSLCPPLVAGALLTVALWRYGATDALPGVWLLLYGTGLMTAGAFSVRVVPVMGACFMALGAAAFAFPTAYGDLFMALGFGGIHMTFGFLIWRRNGG